MKREMSTALPTMRLLIATATTSASLFSSAAFDFPYKSLRLTNPYFNHACLARRKSPSLSKRTVSPSFLSLLCWCTMDFENWVFVVKLFKMQKWYEFLKFQLNWKLSLYAQYFKWVFNSWVLFVLEFKFLKF